MEQLSIDMQPMPKKKRAHASSGYSPALDDARLDSQRQRIYNVMKDHQYRTLKEISALAHPAPEASVSAAIRKFRLPVEEGGLDKIMPKRRRGDPKSGLWEYQMEP